MKKNDNTSNITEELIEINTNKKPWSNRNFRVITAETDPNFIGEYALVEGIAIDLDEKTDLSYGQNGYKYNHGRTVFGLIDRNFNEVLLRNSTWSNSPLEDLTDDFDLSFSPDYAYIFRIDETEFMAKSNNGVWAHMKIEDKLIHRVCVGVTCRTTHNDRMIISSGNRTSCGSCGDALYSMDRMNTVGIAYSHIGDFEPHTIGGETIYLAHVRDSHSYQPSFNLEFYIDENNRIVSHIFCRENGLEYEIGLDGFSYEEVKSAIIKELIETPNVKTRLLKDIKIK